MARQYRPSGPFSTPMELLIPTTSKVKGVTKKTYPKKGETIFGRFRTFGGTEITVNNTVVLENTATIETWFRSDIKADCRIRADGTDYKILGKPEDIEMRHQFLVFRVQAIEGGA